MTPSTSTEFYLDANATTPVLTPILNSVIDAMTDNFGNPSSAHTTGLLAKDLLEQTRIKGKSILGTKEGELLFTSGATEGIQTAVVSSISHHMRTANNTIDKPILMYGATEHKAVPNTLKHWNETLGLHAELMEIPVNKDGKLDYAFIARHVPQAVMICTMAVNNETGVMQDLFKLEEVIRKNNSDVSWLVDCVQALGKVSINMDAISIDYAPFSGHKLYAPKGIGFLYVRSGQPYVPFIAGGGQESGMRSGTENLPGIAGLNTLFSLLAEEEGVFYTTKQLEQHRQMLIEALLDTFPDVSLHAKCEESVPTTINFSLDHYTSKEIIDLFDATGVRVSGGSACSSGVSSSFVLEAMGFDEWQCNNAIRLSFGPADSTEFIESACTAIRSVKPYLSISDGVGDKDAHLLSNWQGITQLVYQNESSWVFASEDKEVLIVNPNPQLFPKIKRLINEDEMCIKTCILNSLSGNSKTLIENVKSTFGQSVCIYHHGDNQSSEVLLSGEHWEVRSVASKQGNLVCLYGKGETELSEQVLNSEKVPSPFDCEVGKTMVISNNSIGLYCEENSSMQNPCLANMNNSVELQNGLSAINWIKAHDAVVLDVREWAEHKASLHLLSKISQECATKVINIPASRLVNAVFEGTLSQDTAYLILCRSGKRSKQQIKAMQSLGFTSLANLTKGLALL
ncbi:aminotransferase class V-fold PLP-dependent enzyme [Pseudoalteromonas luteoviolacea]|uniref:aminotransferase class V-fold PLP-dependent enzyme n=1 Tax=Pseudoalteromonas luteoviolacea TaxID=43657 RepID=UPI001B39E311|nr:aminotransferase class V-fold PLP-dependent enzyme [Pseudoalteromonas luteoviolacea]MBQ4876567.1 aminotransferase class V-fold PLP-dependent enzyme [Pseudoalteromonas luteoviolacea]MBQ4905198.1 aminotransferase class V-fold PLP-dependent enzyme [Pseudoalteromonas luteoviolacea]